MNNFLTGLLLGALVITSWSSHIEPNILTSFPHIAKTGFMLKGGNNVPISHYTIEPEHLFTVLDRVKEAIVLSEFSIGIELVNIKRLVGWNPQSVGKHWYGRSDVGRDIRGNLADWENKVANILRDDFSRRFSKVLAREIENPTIKSWVGIFGNQHPCSSCVEGSFSTAFGSVGGRLRPFLFQL